MKTLLMIEPKEYWEELGVLEDLSRRFHLRFGLFSVYQAVKKIEKGEYAGICTCIYHSPLSLMLTFQAKKFGVPQFYFMDGIGDYSNILNNTYTNKIGVRQLMPPLHTVVFCVDTPTMHFVNFCGGIALGYQPGRVYGWGSKDVSKIEKKYDFLITTANLPYFNESERERLILLLTASVNSLLKRGFKIAFRIYDQKLLKALGRDDVVNLTDENFDCVLNICKCLITTPSSIAIQAANKSVPVAFFDYRDMPDLIQPGWKVHLSVDMDVVWSSMLNQDPDRMLIQRKVLTDSSSVSKQLELYTTSQLESLTVQAEGVFGRSFFSFSGEYYARKIMKLMKKKKLASRIFSFLKKSGVN